MINVELLIEAVTVNERVCHFHSLGFHGVLLGKLVFGDFLIVKVNNFRVHSEKPNK